VPVISFDDVDQDPVGSPPIKVPCRFGPDFQYPCGELDRGSFVPIFYTDNAAFEICLFHCIVAAEKTGDILRAIFSCIVLLRALQGKLYMRNCTLSACIYSLVAGHILQRTVGQSAMVHVGCSNADIFQHLNDLGYAVSDFLGKVHLLPSIDFNIALSTSDICSVRAVSLKIPVLALITALYAFTRRISPLVAS
jgi:hypothetical protein